MNLRPPFFSPFLRLLAGQCSNWNSPDLVSGAEDEKKGIQRLSVAWWANEYLYLIYYGQPVDVTAWDQWKQETIPGVFSER